MKFGSRKLYVQAVFVVLIFSTGQLWAQPDANCAATESNLAWWQEIVSNLDEVRIQADALAYDLLPCLGSPNSELRDDIGYGIYTYWLRNDLLSADTKQFLFGQLSANLNNDDSLLRSFSALILSEMLRADAIDVFLSDAQRSSLLQRTVSALKAERDYRGLEAQLGWVHPIAHMSDVLWRFALHPTLDSNQAIQIADVVREKATDHQAAYVFNEGDRLARVVATLMQRDLITQARWLDWLSEFESRVNDEEWRTVFADVEGMVELHNAKLFLRALASQLTEAELPEELESELVEVLAIFTSMV